MVLPVTSPRSFSREPVADPGRPSCWGKPLSAGGIGAFGQILGEVPDDPRDLVSLTLREGVLRSPDGSKDTEGDRRWVVGVPRRDSGVQREGGDPDTDALAPCPAFKRRLRRSGHRGGSDGPTFRKPDVVSRIPR